MKVLIAGAEGQVGRALVATAPDTAEIRACGRPMLDIADTRSVETCLDEYRPAVIVNAAAYTAVDRAESEPALAYRANAEGPRVLAGAARAVGARLLHISTDFVFDGASSSPYAPGAPTNPLSVYGDSKCQGEKAVLELCARQGVVLRTAWVYAAAGHNFLVTMLRLMNSERSVRVVCDQIGTPTAAASVAKAIWLIIERPHISGVHHWTDAGVASWYDFAVAIAEEGSCCGVIPPDVNVTPVTTAEYPAPARRPPYSVLDKSTLIASGFAPIHWRKQLRRILGEMRGA